ncbi:MAG: DinB family protein [Cyclobacteriaceae bacterium]
MRTLVTVLFLILAINVVLAQSAKPNPPNPTWTEADRQFLLDNLIRSRDELLAATKDLTLEQWNFKESPDRWSISQNVEHLCLWELIHMNSISESLQIGPFPDFTQYHPDELFANGSKSEKKNITTDYTKPFTYSVPLGNNEGKDNMTWFLKMRNESIDYLKTETKNLRVHYIHFGANIHQQYMMIYGHNFRHLRQIAEIKTHPDYPR